MNIFQYAHSLFAKFNPTFQGRGIVPHSSKARRPKGKVNPAGTKLARKARERKLGKRWS